MGEKRNIIDNWLDEFIMSTQLVASIDMAISVYEKKTKV